MSKTKKKIRDVVYGFIVLDQQECAIINHPAFQRLRRIRQLSLTDMVYPGATHTRFEHSLGVMQMATDMYNCIVNNENNISLLKSEYALDETGINRYRKIIRLAALLHDLGHAPFSHSGEDLMPLLPQKHKLYKKGEKKRYKHEEYTIKIIKTHFADLIENHPVNNNYNVKVDEVTALLDDDETRRNAASLLWKTLISGQLDADRADYLLRDSLHIGVNYGLYDRNRLINCMTVGRLESGALTLGIEEKSWHIAESLVLARYQMFSQVYFHKVRRIYDYHLYMATKEILEKRELPGGCYPSPRDIDNYLLFNDWTIYAALLENSGGKHGRIIFSRAHYKCIDKTDIFPSSDDQKRFEALKGKYAGSDYYIDDKATTSWYKLDKDIWICGEKTLPLSQKSKIVAAMVETPQQQRFYVSRDKE